MSAPLTPRRPKRPKIEQDFVKRTRDLIGKMEELSSANDDVAQKRICSEALSMLRSYIERWVENVIHMDVDHSSHKREDLDFLVNQLEEIRKREEIPAKFLLWFLSKLLLARTNRHISVTVGGLLQDALLHSLPWLNNTDCHNLLVTIVEEILPCLLLKERSAPHIALMDLENTDEAWQVKISISPVDDCRFVLLQCLTDLLISDIFELHNLSPAGRLKLATFMLLSYDEGGIAQKTSSVLVLQRLFLASDVVVAVFNLALRKILKMECFFAVSEPSCSYLPRANEKEDLASAHESCYKIFSDKLKDWRTSNIGQFLTVSDLMDFGILAATAVRKYKERPIPDRIDVIVSTVCVILSGISTNYCEDIVKLFRFADDVKMVLQRRLFGGYFQSGGNKEFMASYLAFLFVVEEISGDTSRTRWLTTMGMERIARMKKSNYTEGMRLQQDVASAIARCNSEGAIKMLPEILPKKEELLMLAEKCSSLGGSEILITLMNVVSSLSEMNSVSSEDCISFLSLPWISGLNTVVDRHCSSLPLLRELKKIAKNCHAYISKDVRTATLPSLAKIKGHTEWRRTIFLEALKCPDSEVKLTALTNMPILVHSMEKKSYSLLLKPVVELAEERSGVDKADILSALASSICKIHSSTSSAAHSAFCAICAGEVLLKETPVDVPVKALELLEDVFKGDFCSLDKDLRLKTVTLFTAIIAHCPNLITERVISASFVAILDVDVEVRHEYLLGFSHFLKYQITPRLVENLKSVVDPIRLETKEMSLCRYYEAASPFFVACCRYSTDNGLREWAILFLYRIVIRFVDADEFSKTLRNLVIELSNSESNKFLMQRIRAFSAVLVEEMQEIEEQRDAFDESVVDYVDGEVDTKLLVTRYVFGLESVTSFLTLCARHVIPLLAMCVERKQDISLSIIRCIAKHYPFTQSKMSVEIVPSLLAYRTVHPEIKYTQRYVGEALGIHNFDMDRLIATEAYRYHCSTALLRSLSLNEERCLLALRQVCSRRIQSFSLTEVMKIQSEYLGQLMNFRSSLLDDCYFEVRDVLIRSFVKLLSRLNQDFMDQIAPKLIVILRAATQAGAIAIQAWQCFIDNISIGTLATLLPQILIGIDPLLPFPSVTDLLDNIFSRRTQVSIEHDDSFERTAMVLLGRAGLGSASVLEKYLRASCQNITNDRIIKACVKMLSEECENVGKVVLRQLYNILRDDSVSDSLTALLVPALLDTLKRCSEKEVRLLAVKCLGRLGAVDPGRLALESSSSTNEKKELIFVDDSDVKFFTDLLKRCWQTYSNMLDDVMIDQVEYCLQEILVNVVKKDDPSHILTPENFPPEVLRDIAPLRNANFVSNNDEPMATSPRPIIDHVSNFSDWLKQCYLLGASSVSGPPFSFAFRAMKWICNNGDSSFTRWVLPQLLLRLSVESQAGVLKEYVYEMKAVLRKVTQEDAGWIQLAAHVVFGIMDSLEQYVVIRSDKENLSKNKDLPKKVERIKGIIRSLVEIREPNGQLLIVIAAEKCHCLFRALKWCEQYSIEKDSDFKDLFDQPSYYTLERLYSQLGQPDGVLGAFECIAEHGTPTVDESILMLEAMGDYHEALPLYAHSSSNKELQMIKCLLRLNEPQLALSTAISSYERYSNDTNVADALMASQIEATWHLREWQQLEPLVENNLNLLSTADMHWGASCAAIMCAVKKKDEQLVGKRLEIARERLVGRLTAMTIEHSDTYAQAYKYISQLHILEEIEQASSALGLFDSSQSLPPPAIHLTSLLSKWQARSESAIQCASVLEPILHVRRELLKDCASAQAKNAISQLLIQSCRLARQAGHSQIAWTFLVECKALDTNLKDVGMEEARFQFQQGNQQQAIGLLSKLLRTQFDDMNRAFVAWTENTEPLIPSQLNRAPSDEKAAFAEVQLLRAEYMMKAGAVGASDLYKIYKCLRELNVPSEDLYYRVAVFCDGMFMMDSEGSQKRSDLITLILKTYVQVLKHGKNHLFHAMPRMLTIWLDVTEKKMPVEIAGADLTQKEMAKQSREEIDKMNKEMLGFFRELDTYYFYTSFPQLVSRIVHPSESVFHTLKTMMAEILCKYPHQCLWQSIALYRNKDTETSGGARISRKERCAQVYQVACHKMQRLSSLIDQYDYISYLFLEVAKANTDVSYGSCSDLPTRFPKLHEFLTTGTIDPSRLVPTAHRNPRVQRNVQRVSPTIMIPLAEMLEHALPKQKLHETRVECFSQFDILSERPSETFCTELPEVLIHSIDKEYLVLRSMMKPKRITLRATNGQAYHIMCKQHDEMRKDARFMDFNRMMNALMRQNADARRRQLLVRTFSVIPLQDKGGILEWVPMLTPYKHALDTLFPPRSKQNEDANYKTWTSNANASLEDKIERMRSIYKMYPLVMADWFRREFFEPAKWHAARTNFARSSAVMSMIGFVLGLGDRHGENILLDLRDGGVVHVDFNLMFNAGERLPVKEVVPFRLTRNMVNGMGPTGVEGVFRKACEATMRVMRDNKETLLTVTQTFVHDPLLEWAKTEERSLQNRQTGKRYSTTTKPAGPQELASNTVSMIAKRLEGHIISPDVYKLKFSAPPMGIEGQVSKLIELATDESLLAQMFYGWSPFM